MSKSYTPPTIREVFRMWLFCMAIIMPLAGACRLIQETDGFSVAGRARLTQKIFDTSSSAATLAIR